eukprot:SAG31_NODE_9958_length_1205_cov_1.467450_1_plen_29_part_10
MEVEIRELCDPCRVRPVWKRTVFNFDNGN